MRYEATAYILGPATDPNDHGYSIFQACVTWNDNETPEDAGLLRNLLDDAINPEMGYGRIKPEPTIECAKAIFDFIAEAMSGADARLVWVMAGPYRAIGEQQ